MAFRDTWHRALVYFGLAEDPEYQESDLYEPDTGSQGEYYERASGALRKVSRIRSGGARGTRSTTSSPTTSRWAVGALARCARSAATEAPTYASTW